MMTSQNRVRTATVVERGHGAVSELVARRVYGEFVEMPDLRITCTDAQRLFGLGETECAMVLDCLAEFGVLTRLPDGCYARTAAE